MARTDMPLSPEKHPHFIPGKGIAQRRILREQRIDTLGVEPPESAIEGPARGRGFAGDARDFVSRTARQSSIRRNNSTLPLPQKSSFGRSRFLLDVAALFLAANSSIQCRARHDRRAPSKSSASLGPHNQMDIGKPRAAAPSRHPVALDHAQPASTHIGALKSVARRPCNRKAASVFRCCGKRQNHALIEIMFTSPTSLSMPDLAPKRNEIPHPAGCESQY